MHWFGLSSAGSHANLFHMMFTLKVIGFAFERNSVYEKSKSLANDLTAAEQEIQEITITNMFHYFFNYIGLLIGKNFR